MTDVTAAVAQEPDGTRARILAEAIDMFSRHGYHRTTLSQLADRIGITKAAILYHFPAKERIIAALMEPFVGALEAAVDRAARVPLPDCRTVLIEGILDTYLDHRTMLQMARIDSAIFTHEPMYQRMMRLPGRMIDIMVGPGRALPERVWAIQVVSTLGDCLVLIDDKVPRAELREMVLAGTRRLLAGGPDGGVSGVSGTIREPPRVGRPRVLGESQLSRAHQMHRSGSYTVNEIATELGISRATVYRYLADQPSQNESHNF
jgi:AcrR family transcriptional regulator